jgi:hypothetical protein
MLGNLLFFVNKLDEMSRLFLKRPMPDVISGQDLLLIVIGQVALIIGYVAFLQVYAPSGKFSRITLRLFGWGGMILAVGHIVFMSGLTDVLPPAAIPFVRTYGENLFLLVLLGLLLMIPGLILFGINNLRTPVIARWRWLPLATGVMGFIGFFLFGGEGINTTFLIFRTLFALGLIGLGFILWMENPSQPKVA